ncbi:hypothetical protein HanPSC8_Chr09g0350601 [Helianthus annuus]|nr:hypothetical protein HanPSC8_Chr09g0350601 [Helianthus annuus]
MNTRFSDEIGSPQLMRTSHDGHVTQLILMRRLMRKDLKNCSFFNSSFYHQIINLSQIFSFKFIQVKN